MKKRRPACHMASLLHHPINSFKKMVAVYYPHHKFRNAFAEKNLFGARLRWYYWAAVATHSLY
jgi:hypothetical protein